MSTDEDVATARRRWSDLSERTRRPLSTAAVADGPLWPRVPLLDRPIRHSARSFRPGLARGTSRPPLTVLSRFGTALRIGYDIIAM